MEHQSPPRLIVRERSRSPVRGESPVERGGDMPSPLRETSFRLQAAEFPDQTPSTSCEYSPHPDDVLTPGGTLKAGGCCAAVRTVGYSTVGGKNFMSGRCPNCKRLVKSSDQVCTPNATPPPSPWRAALSSPLRSLSRSPGRSSKTGSKTPVGEASSPRTPPRSPPRSPLRSPLRSPFKSPPRFRGRAMVDEAPKGSKWEECKDEVMPSLNPFQDEECHRNCVRDASRSPMRSSARSPWNVPSKIKDYEGDQDEQQHPGERDLRERGRPQSPPARASGPVRANTQGAFFNGPRHVEEPLAPGGHPMRTCSLTRKSRSLSPVRISTNHSMQSPLSPVRSPYIGSFFDQPIREESEASVGRAGIPASSSKRGRLRSQSPFRSPLRSPFSQSGLRSPLRSPFRTPWFGKKAAVETE